METQRRHDLSIALLLCVPIVSAYVLVGDVLYLGWWYYALVLGLPIVLALPFKPRAYFLSGVSLSANLCLWSYWAWQYWIWMHWHHIEPMLGLFHFLEISGWALGWLIALFILYYAKTATKPFRVGCLCPTLGFAVAHLVIYTLNIFSI